MTTNRTCRCTRSWLLMVVACVALRHVEAFSYSSPFQTNHRFSSAPRSTKTAIHLFSVPKATLISTVGHVMGGVTGTPTVVQGTQKGGWYRRIGLPTWTPPDRVFAPVWTLLYSMMGVAFSRVGRAAGFGSPVALLWLFHYALNLSWAPVFFGRQRLRLALWINWGLLATLSVIIPWFWKIDCLAGALLIPYAAWLLFATALNAKICRLNPTVNGYNEAKFQAGLLNLQKKAAAYADS